MLRNGKVLAIACATGLVLNAGTAWAAKVVRELRAATPETLACLEDANGNRVHLPGGRYALLLVDSRRLPGSLNLPTEIKAKLKLVLYARYETSIPELAAIVRGLDTLEARYRLPPGSVLAECPGSAGRRLGAGDTLLPGLYLMDGREARYRFIFFSGAEQEAGPVLRALRRYLSGGEPVVFPLPLLDPGTRVGGVCPWGTCALYPFTGTEADIEPEQKMALKTGREGFLRLPEGWLHRQGAELLTQAIQEAGVHGVGLVTGGDAEIEGLKTRFPHWRFIALRSPQDRIRFHELLPIWTVVVREERVQRVLAFAPRLFVEEGLRDRAQREILQYLEDCCGP